MGALNHMGNTPPPAAPAAIRCRTLILTFGPPQRLPWWWPHIAPARIGAHIEYARVSLGAKRASQVGTTELPRVLLKIARALWRARRFDYLITFECDLVSFGVALLQTLLFRRRPRHVIVQFIMREKRNTLASRVKYRFLTFCFASVHRIICSSRAEGDYYRETFGWPASKVAFVPFHTDPAFIDSTSDADDGFIVAAGRSFRDYPTFLAAVAGLPARVIVVASPGCCSDGALPANVELRYDIPPHELDRLIARCRLLVLPLEDRRISIGQSVLLQGMAHGKAVIATRTAGTEDYVDDGINGLLVPPCDAPALRRALESLLHDADTRARLGRAARERILERHLPQHYVDAVAQALGERTRSED